MNQLHSVVHWERLRQMLNDLLLVRTKNAYNLSNCTMVILPALDAALAQISEVVFDTYVLPA
ncbi:MAG: hypothetical protein ACWIPH_09465 [Ostreibacterium sp.]